jgi:PIN domain nuclease of toxin-antitoxin system
VSRRVVDASALLAYIDDEPGADAVEERLPEGVLMSAVNWAEVLSKLAERRVSIDRLRAELVEAGILGRSLEISPFTEDEAVIAGELRPATRDLGFSLADRACLALAVRTALPVVTADRAWAEARLPVAVELVR